MSILLMLLIGITLAENENANGNVKNANPEHVP